MGGSTQRKNPLKFKDLGTIGGALRLSEALDGGVDDAVLIRERAIEYLKASPELREIEIGKIPAGAGVYDTTRNRVGLAKANPDILAHEIEHARVLRDPSLYRSILQLSKGASGVATIAALPTVLGLHYFIKDRDKRNAALKNLAGIAAIAAVPNLIEEGRASIRAVSGSPDKAQTVTELVPGFGAHLAQGMLAPGILYAGTRV